MAKIAFFIETAKCRSRKPRPPPDPPKKGRAWPDIFGAREGWSRGAEDMEQELLTGVARSFDTCHTIMRHLSKVPAYVLQEPGKGFSFTRSGCRGGVDGGLPDGCWRTVRRRIRKRTEAYSYEKGEILGSIGSKSDIFV
jgi:hypothetical protein